MLTPLQIKAAEIARILSPVIGSQAARERANNIAGGEYESVSEIEASILRGEVSARQRGYPWHRPSRIELAKAAVEIFEVLNRG